VPFFVGFVVVVSLIGVISMFATMIKARRILPKNRFGPFVSRRRRNVVLAVAVLFGLSLLAMMASVINLLNTPASNYNGATFLFLGAAFGAAVLSGMATGFTLAWASLVKPPRYPIRGERKGG
jgi:hypothetical protein